MMAKFLILSTLFHLVVYFSFYFLKTNDSPKSPDLVTIEVANIAFTESESKTNKVPNNTKSKAKTKNKNSKTKNNNFFSIRNVIPSQYQTLFNKNIKTYNTGSSDLSIPDNPYSLWGTGAAEFERLADYSYLERIYERVNNNLFYPGIFAYNNIFGTVNARLVIDSFGNCNWQMTQINSTNVNLKVYILSVLKKTCMQDLKLVTQLRKQLNIDLSFSFELTERSVDKNEDNKMIIGNVLHFYRNSAKSMLEWNLGPLKGMFPLPYVQLDITWLQIHWEKYINDKDLLKEFIKDHSS